MTIRIERDPPGSDFSLLLREYDASLSFDLGFQDFASELEGLPAPYAAPDGARLLAYVDDEPAGCVAVRRFGTRTAELKRLYVRPAHRGLGLGRRLTEEAIEIGRTLGFARIRLDTTPEMATAHALYRSLGFREIDPYRPNPVAGTRYFELELGPVR
jgi:putative acetyltransferase